ncbi:MAG: hypothetical protein WBF93_14350 [Pirellulales bacterium]
MSREDKLVAVHVNCHFTTSVLKTGYHCIERKVNIRGALMPLIPCFGLARREDFGTLRAIFGIELH